MYVLGVFGFCFCLFSEVQVRLEFVTESFTTLSHLNDGPYEFAVDILNLDSDVNILANTGADVNFDVRWFYSDADLVERT